MQVANGLYMVGGTTEAEIALQFVNHRELSRPERDLLALPPDLGKEISLRGNFYEA